MTWTEYQDSMTIEQLRQAAIAETREAIEAGTMTPAAGAEMLQYLQGAST